MEQTAWELKFVVWMEDGEATNSKTAYPLPRAPALRQSSQTERS